MNWYRRHKVAAYQKVAYPYSSNLCPKCSEPLMLDFYWEKHKRNIGLGVGHCPHCKVALKADLLPYKKVENKEETMGFRFSNLTPISEKQYVRLKPTAPEILISADTEGMATEKPYEGQTVNEVNHPDPMEGEGGQMAGSNEPAPAVPAAV